MMTRRANARQEENKLQLTLIELKKSKDLCDQLLRERDDNEKEVINILDCNRKLKCELAELHTSYVDAISQRDQLQEIVNGFGQCGEEFENTLRHITELEHKLGDANNTIASLELSHQHHQDTRTQTLYHELIPSRIPTSKNKLKKYIKVNRLIQKTKNLLKTNYKAFAFCKKHNNIFHKLNLTKQQLENNHLKYEADIQHLESKVTALTASLQQVTMKYNSSRVEIQEHILALSEVVDMSKYNYDRFTSLSNKCNCGSDVQPSHVPHVLPSEPLLNDSSTKLITSKNRQTQNILLYSDELGKDMGLHLSHSTCQALNHCVPGADYRHLVSEVLSDQCSSCPTIAIMCGRRGNMNKDEMTKLIDSLSCLSVKHIILFAFPYSKGLSQRENTTRYRLNCCMQIISNYDNKFSFIDLNNNDNSIISYYNLINERYHLSHKFKGQVASMLHYFIHIFNLSSAKSLATNTASIEQSNHDHNNYSLEYVPNTLN